MNRCPNMLTELSDEQFMEVFTFAHRTVTMFADVVRSEYDGKIDNIAMRNKIQHIKVIRCAFPGLGLKAAKFFSEMALEYKHYTR